MKFITFSSLNFSIGLYLIFFILIIVNEYIVINIKKGNIFLSNTWISIGGILGGLPKIIYDIYIKFTLKKRRNLQELQLSSKSQFNYMITNTNINQKLLAALTIFLLASLHLGQDIFININSHQSDFISYTNLIFCIFFLLTLLVVTHYGPFQKLFLHHYISLAIVIIGFILVFYSTLTLSLNIISEIFQGIIFALIISGIKYIMEQKYVHPCTLIFYYGLIYLVLLWGFYVICYLTRWSEGIARQVDSLYGDFREVFNSSLSIVMVFLAIIVNGSMNTIAYMIIYYESAMICQVISYFGICCTKCVTVSFIVFKGDAVFYLCLIGSILSCFGTLMLVEIIIVHYCGLDENTEEAIEVRSCRENDNNGVDMMINED